MNELFLSRVHGQGAASAVDARGGHDGRGDGVTVEADARRGVERGRVVHIGVPFEHGAACSQRCHRAPHVLPQRRGSLDHVHPHQVRQRPARHVVRLVRRPLRVLAQVRVVLHGEELAHEVGEGLVHRDHPRPGRVGEPVVRDRLVQLMHLDPVVGEAAQHLDRRYRIVLLLRHEIGVRRTVRCTCAITSRPAW